MTRDETFNTRLAREAEQARIDRDGEPASAPLKVKVIADHAISVAGNTHDPGHAFTAQAVAVEQALARSSASCRRPRSHGQVMRGIVEALAHDNGGRQPGSWSSRTARCATMRASCAAG